MRISQDIVEKKLAEAPEAIRAQATSDDVANALATIAQEHGLHIDQAGIIDEETLYVMLGIEEASDFVEKLRERLNLSEPAARSLAEDINKKIFLAIRNSLQAQPQEESASATKEDILAEIENPLPTIHPISAADQTIPGPAMQREVILEAPKPPQAPASNDLLANKLTQPQNSPAQKVKYAVDPYREPIN